MSGSPDRLYELLPAIYRLRDSEQGYPLRDVLRVIAEQVDVVEDDITQLYDNWFVETSQDWAVPYVADLIGYRPVHEAGEPGNVAAPREQQRNRILIPRREVANTLHYRRRKGTLALLEALANDVADWPARAVEFYRLLDWTQHLNHQRLKRGRTVNLRDGDALDLVGGPFEKTAHMVEVRRINSHHAPGRANIPSVGVFVWRLKTYSVTRTPAYCLEQVEPQCYTFSVLGNDTPLYNRPQPETDPTHIAQELNLPTPIRRRAFEDRVWAGREVEHIQASADYYGLDKSLAIWAPDWPRKGAEQPIPREAIIPADLTDWQYRAPRSHVAVDPVLGRIVFPAGQLPKQGAWVTYHYAFSADIGGGEYDRVIPQPSIVALSRFRADDVKDGRVLAIKLKTAADAVSRYISAQLSPESQQLLGAYDEAGPPSAELLDALRCDLDELLGDAAFYDAQRFNGIALSDEAAALIAQDPQGEQLVRLNRLLLEAAYPNEIATSYILYRVSRTDKITDALEQWQTDQPRHAAIEITESAVYVEQFPTITLGKNQSLQLRAANRVRPVIRLLDWHTELPDSITIKGAPGSQLTLDGLLITGRGVQVTANGEDYDSSAASEGDLCQLVIRHCTLVPGWGLHSDCEPKRPAEPSLELVNTRAQVKIEHSIVGSIQVVADQVKTDPLEISISDSILDATREERVALGASNLPLAYAVATFARCTVIGQVQTHAIELGENSIFYGLIRVGRRQRGCLRFCYVTPGSRTPRRYECQPDLVERAIEEQVAQGKLPRSEQEDEQKNERLRVRPQFNSTRYGTPTYGQLADTCADEIKRGAEDESEMGVFHDLYQPQRAANLRARLDEYTPAGMEAGIIYAS